MNEARIARKVHQLATILNIIQDDLANDLFDQLKEDLDEAMVLADSIVTLKEEAETKYVVIQSTPEGGKNYFGPFDGVEARQYMENHAKSGPMYAVNMESPEGN